MFSSNGQLHFCCAEVPGGERRRVCYENNNYRIQVWNVGIRREQGGEREGGRREHTWPISLRQGVSIGGLL